MFTPTYIRNNNNIHILFPQIKLPISDFLPDFEINTFAFKYDNFLWRARMNSFR